MSDNGSASGNAQSSRNFCLAISLPRVRAVPIGMCVLRKSYQNGVADVESATDLPKCELIGFDIGQRI